MPTYDTTDQFDHDYQHLSSEQRLAFNAAVRQLVEDLKSHQPLRTSLRVKRFHRRQGTYELSWAANGRALFRYGTSPSPHIGDVHIIWEAVGTHDIFKR